MRLTQKDDFMLTAEEIRLRRRTHRRFLIILLLLLVLALGGVVGARPAGRAIKAWQARRHAQKAFVLIEEQNWQEARKEAVAAYQLRQTEPQALRAVARFLSRTRQQQALEFWDQLAQKQALTREDRHDATAVALALGELERGAATLEPLLADDGKEATPTDWLLAAQLRLQQGAPEKALDSLGRVFSHPEASARHKFQASLLQLQAARTGNLDLDRKNQTEARERLVEFAKGDDAVGLDALVLLAQRQLSQTSEILSPDDLIRRLEGHPLGKAAQKLLAIDLQLQANPGEREALISHAIEQWKDAEQTQLAILALWLNGKGEFQRQLDVIPQEHALQSRELFLQHMDALGALGRWEEIARLLGAERFPLEPVIQHMYLARANAQLGKEAAAKNNWQRALEAAAADAGKLMTLAQYAEKNGALEVAESAYREAIGAAPRFRPAWDGHLRMIHASRETKHIHGVLGEMLRLWPNDIAIQNDEAYMSLLLIPNEEPSNPELIEIERLAEQLMQRNPASLPHRTLLALARLKQQRPVAALQIYEGIQATPNALTPSALAVHAAVLSANGDMEAARHQIAQIAPERLLPEEQAGTANLRE